MTFVFADPTCSLFVPGVTIKYKALRLIGVYALDEHSERPDLFRRIEPFLMTSRVWEFLFPDRPVKILGFWFDPDILQE